MIDKHRESIVLMAWALIIGGVVMWVVDVRYATGSRTTDMDQMSLGQAIWIGICQVVSAVIPGTSRSMSTIAAGQIAGMSRTAFALRFKSQVGWSPIDYVLRWRMRLAARTLSTGRAPLAELARSLGYESETAFGVAFKRVMGCTPKQYKAQIRRTGEAQSG